MWVKECERWGGLRDRRRAWRTVGGGAARAEAGIWAPRRGCGARRIERGGRRRRRRRRLQPIPIGREKKMGREADEVVLVASERWETCLGHWMGWQGRWPSASFGPGREEREREDFWAGV
jgi:hypothetical protein